MRFMGFLCQEMSFVYDDYSHHVGQGKNYQGFHASVKCSVCSATQISEMYFFAGQVPSSCYW